MDGSPRGWSGDGGGREGRVLAGCWVKAERGAGANYHGNVLPWLLFPPHLDYGYLIQPPISKPETILDTGVV